MAVINMNKPTLEAAEFTFQFHGEFSEDQYARLAEIVDGAISAHQAGSETGFDVSKFPALELNGDFTFEDAKRHKIQGAEIEVEGIHFMPRELLFAIRRAHASTEDRIISSRQTGKADNGRHFIKDRSALPVFSFDTERFADLTYDCALLGRLAVPVSLIGERVSESFVWPREFSHTTLKTVYDNAFVATVLEDINIPD